MFCCSTVSHKKDERYDLGEWNKYFAAILIQIVVFYIVFSFPWEDDEQCLFLFKFWILITVNTFPCCLASWFIASLLVWLQIWTLWYVGYCKYWVVVLVVKKWYIFSRGWREHNLFFSSDMHFHVDEQMRRRLLLFIYLLFFKGPDTRHRLNGWCFFEFWKEKSLSFSLAANCPTFLSFF